jgi:hypothetical protein
MPVFDTNDAPVSPARFTEKLIGVTCEITFTLKHYAIKAQKGPASSVSEPYDTFSAQVEAVVILKNPPVLAPSPYKGRLTRRPLHRPQLPTRGEQLNAAEAFVPQPAFGQTSPGLSTIPALDGRADEVAVTSQTPTAAIPSTAPSTTGNVTNPSSVNAAPPANLPAVSGNTNARRVKPQGN